MIFNTKNCHMYVKHASNATFKSFSWSNKKEILWSKYQIKESDFRSKTMNFTSPQYIDLTTGIYGVLISSPYHPNFSGVILSIDYNEDTKLYTYQCQDWSRFYQSKIELIINNRTIYYILRALITKGGLSISKPHKSSDLSKWKNTLSGLKSVNLYDQKLLGNIVNGNPMKNKPSLIIRDKSYIETIRALTIGTMRYTDVWFNDKGIIQIQPLSRNDWYNTGLVLSTNEYMNRDFKFDTTNAITGVIVNGSEYKKGKYYSSQDLLGLDLSAFFGKITSTVNSLNESTVITGNNKSSSNSTSNSASSNSSSSKNGNPYNNKAKRVWINADNGSSGMKSQLIKLLEKDGWSVHDGGTGSNNHYRDYWDVTSKYSVYITLYNGFCAGTVREAYSSKIQNELKRKGVQLVPIWDSAGWTNPQGMKPYRYGDFSGYSANRAWDDNFSSSNPAIKNVADYLKSNNAKYCVNPTASGIMAQFRAGGYFASKNGGSTTNSSNSTNSSNTKSSSNKSTSLNNTLLNQSNASNKIYEHARDYFSCKLTLPLGNTALKEVHTNQFLFTNLPVEFDLANWTVLAKALSSSYNRYSSADYVTNRWYIEGITIDVDVKGTAKMQFELNAFASSTNKFSDDYKSFTKAFDDAGSKSSSGNSSTKKTTNSVSNGDNTTLKGGQGTTIDNLVKKIVGNETDPLKKAKLIHEWLRQNVIYSYYCCSKYKTPENCYKNRSHLNCADTAILTTAMMKSAGLTAYYVHRTYNGGHFWCVIEINGKKYASDQTGRESASMSGSAWNTVWKRSGRTGNGGYADYSNRNMCYSSTGAC